MNTTIRTALAGSAVLLVTACGTTTAGERAATPRAAQADVARVAPGATYDGWAVRRQWDNTVPSCPWSPAQVERMMDAGQPLPACVRRLERWFQENYDPAWVPNGPTAGR